VLKLTVSIRSPARSSDTVGFFEASTMILTLRQSPMHPNVKHGIADHRYGFRVGSVRLNQLVKVVECVHS